MALIACPECKKNISETVFSCPHCGYAFKIGEVKKIKGEKQNSQAIGLVVLIVLVFIGYKWCFSSSSSSEPAPLPWYQQDNSSMAWTYTKNYVKTQLKSPSSAKFPWDYREYVTRNGTSYVIKSYVDSQNSFGAMIRTQFIATVEQTSEDYWTTASFELLE